MTSSSTFCTAVLKSVPLAIRDSSSVARWSSASARMVLIVVIGAAIDCNAPGARNSNRLPVNANGLVRLRSPGSVGSTGSVSTPMVNAPFSLELVAPPFAIWSNTSVSWSPRKIEMIAGGASFAPRR